MGTASKILGEKVVEAPPPDATAKQLMAHRLKTAEGSKQYGLLKQTVEPVFGIIKQAIRFRQFLMRGMKNVSTEWNLVCTTCNIKRIFSLKKQKQAAALASAVQMPEI